MPPTAPLWIRKRRNAISEHVGCGQKTYMEEAADVYLSCLIGRLLLCGHSLVFVFVRVASVIKLNDVKVIINVVSDVVDGVRKLVSK